MYVSVLSRVFQKFVHNGLSTPLGRWGVPHDKVLDLFERHDYYDHGLDHEKHSRLCKHRILPTTDTSYCLRCFRLKGIDGLLYNSTDYGYIQETSICRKLYPTEHAR